MFLSLGTIGIWGQIMLCYGGLSCALWGIYPHPRLFSLDASISPVVTIKNVSSHYQLSPGEPNCSPLPYAIGTETGQPMRIYLLPLVVGKNPVVAA